MKIRYGMSCETKLRYLKEHQRTSKYAPKLSKKGLHVCDTEELGRLVFFPDFIDQNDKLKPEGISHQDLVKRGFSLFRLKHTCASVTNNIVHNQTQNNTARQFKGTTVFRAAEVRALRDSYNDQAFVIFDHAPTKELHGHAMIMCANDLKRSEVKELRKKIVDFLQPVRQNVFLNC